MATQGPGKGAPQAEATEQQDPVLIVFQAPDEPVGRCSKDPSLMLTVSPEWWVKDQATGTQTAGRGARLMQTDLQGWRMAWLAAQEMGW